MNEKISREAKAPAGAVIRPAPAPVPAVSQKPKGALDERTLREAGEFTVIFADDKGFKCRLLAADNYNLIVESNGRRLLIPKHAVKYVALPASFSP
jgi:sRNA-binding regulator protein Hfq